MTTTAEKIKNLASRITELNDRHLMLHDALTVLYTDLRKLQRQENTKPADPEPRECWVNVYEGERQPACVHMDEQKARIARLNPGKTVHMREITPQDEQDRLDAARYRKSKELHLQLCETAATNWDAIIDKAIKDQ